MSDQWEELPLSSVVNPSRRITYGVVQPGPDVSPDGIPLIRGKDYSSGKVDTSSLYHVSQAIDAPYSRSKVQAGDILFSIVGYVGLVAEVPPELSGANITQTTARISVDPSKASGRFVAQVLSAPHYRSKITRYEKGSAQPGLNLADVERLSVSLPPLSQQQRIAGILSTVDEAIEQTEALIAKTQQIKAGLMHDLFTRGVTPDGQLRPPREEAPQLYKKSPLGWIPKEWDVTKLRDCLLENPTNGIYKPAELIGSGALLVGQTSFTSERSIDYGLARRAIVDDEEQRRYGLATDDILVTRVFATVEGVGRPVLVPPLPEAAVYESNMMRMRVNRDLVRPQLLFELLRDDRASKLLARGINASNQCSVNQSVLNPLPVPRPLADEQEQLLEMIRADGARHASERAVLRKLKQLKSGLMHDLLTGRVPVSLVAAADV